MNESTNSVIRPPAETLYAAELAALAANDNAPRPEGWKLSPRATRDFVLGSQNGPLAHEWKGKKTRTEITRKFYGDDILIERAIVTLMSNRGLILVGEPGTAKSMLSELLAAAVSGVSTYTIQGAAGITDDAIKYSWNYALLLAEGPTPRALVPSPLYLAMRRGAIVRFEEITRCQPEIQDALIGLMSEKVMFVPELGEEHGALYAAKGFNVLATANLRDRGVNEMSSALKRRFNFETVRPIANKEQEIELVTRQVEALLREAGAPEACPTDVMDLLVTMFRDLREGRTEEGTIVEKPSAIMSTAEAVAVGFSAGLDARHFGNGRTTGAHVARHMIGTAFKDDPDDAKRLRQYFDVIVKARAQKSQTWKSCHEARRALGS